MELIRGRQPLRIWLHLSCKWLGARRLSAGLYWWNYGDKPKYWWRRITRKPTAIHYGLYVETNGLEQVAFLGPAHLNELVMILREITTWVNECTKCFLPLTNCGCRPKKSCCPRARSKLQDKVEGKARNMNRATISKAYGCIFLSPD